MTRKPSKDSIRRRGRSSDRGEDAAKKEKVLNVQDAATAAAWDVPVELLVCLCVMPTVGLGVAVARLDNWIAVQLGLCTAVSIVGYVVTRRMIPLVGPKIVDKLYGVDIGKRGLGGANDGKRIPESLGVVSGTVFMLSVGVMQFCFGSQNDQLIEYHTALLSVCFSILLGLMDDIIDIRWRDKVIIGAFISLPLLLTYKGSTSILVPKFLLAWSDGSTTFLADMLEHIPTVSVGGDGLLDLGAVYYLYMFAMVVFCTNAINIYAGINGLEVGQAIIVGLSITVVNLLELYWRGGTAEDILSGDGRNHLFSLMIMLPFITTSFALLTFNFYPAKVFVGDVYPYYAGMTLAVAAILGHFSKSLLFLVIPQLLNFIYSLPQLFKIVPVPRHRLPRVNVKTGFLEPSKVAPGDNRNNMTLITLALEIFGTMHERTLCVVLLAFQALCGILGVALRQKIGGHM
mmetsp:Transcript_12468/g.20171  ORF Transcript_12468/g.20171 Transcript_12468/m.20171 type:complete len:458 (+) Transcript_12468:222-1595(+)|eukprot:CAMPEP_0203745096 /NCGR_PEP_ID=MMETSP0098-20131031/952_1 /ASSEMBLY_ACC=CAM_ASM_000208 /TAXON_ID=96639 /ORGANISM=" , Strain NY0313808BC1" /LENGTH=457 /DNA_ID=CAMNT_0050632791 /DNA_START=175 /DNA_END=1548 /DNA_ORIENTATION=-